MSDTFFDYPNSKYADGIVLNIYNGQISLVAAYKTDNGPAMRWCKTQKGKDAYADKAIPMKIKLGDSPEEAIAMLRQIAKEIQGG